LRPQPAIDRAPGLGALDQVGARQDIEVLDHRRERDRERRRNLRDGQFALARKAIDDGAPRWIGERREG